MKQFKKINLMKKLVLILVVSLCSTVAISQTLLSPTGLTTLPLNTFYGSSAGSCYDGSGLSSTSVPNVTSALGVVHTAPADEYDAAYSGPGSIETSWKFDLGSTQNVKGIALWTPCAQHPHGDAPFKKIAVYNGTTTDIFDLGYPSDQVKIINFSSTYMGTTSIEIQVLETWYDLDLSSPNCGASGWGVYSLSSTINAQHNVMLGEIMFILDDNVAANPCEIDIEIEKSVERCGLNLNASISNIPAGYTVMSTTWTFGDGYSSNSLNTSHYYANAGVYNVCLEVIVFNGEQCCTVEKCFEIQIEEPCEDDCNIEAEIEVEQLEGCEFQFFGSILYTGSPITNWVWNFGDGTTATGSNVTHTYSANGTYEVTLTIFGSSPNNEECCFTTIRREINVDCIHGSDSKRIKGVASSDHKATIYPNPSNGTFMISSLNSKVKMTTIEVYDMSSRLVYSLNSVQNQTRVNVDLKNQQSGIYLVKIVYADGSVKQQKVVVEK